MFMKRLFALCSFCFLFPSGYAQTTNQKKLLDSAILNIRSAGSPTLSSTASEWCMWRMFREHSRFGWWFAEADSRSKSRIMKITSGCRAVAAGNGLIFGKARGGDENTQFFWMAMTARTSNNWRTTLKSVQLRRMVKRRQKDLLPSNKRDRNWFDVYVMDAESGKEKCFCRTTAQFGAAVSDDGSKSLFRSSSTRFSLDNDLYLRLRQDERNSSLTRTAKPRFTATFILRRTEIR